MVKFDKFPISKGIEPVNPLNEIFKLVRLVKFPISGGIEPVNPQNPQENVSKYIGNHNVTA